MSSDSLNPKSFSRIEGDEIFALVSYQASNKQMWHDRALRYVKQVRETESRAFHREVSNFGELAIHAEPCKCFRTHREPIIC